MQQIRQMFKRVTESMLHHTGEKYWCMEHYSKPRDCCSGQHACCVDCGDHNLRELVVDHTQGGGCEERRKHCLGIGGHKYYAWLRRQGYPDDLGIEVRCNTCHRERHKRESQEKNYIDPSTYPILNPNFNYPVIPITGNTAQMTFLEVQAS